MHFNILAIMMAQVGFVTPPFGLCLFVSMKLAVYHAGGYQGSFHL